MHVRTELGGNGGGKTNTHHRKVKLSKFQKAASKWNKAEFKIAKAAVKGMKDVESDKEEEVSIKGITMGIICDHFPLCCRNDLLKIALSLKIVNFCLLDPF